MSAVVQAGMNDAVIRVNAAVSTQTARSYCQLHPANGGKKKPELFCWVKVFHLTISSVAIVLGCLLHCFLARLIVKMKKKSV